MGQIIEVPGVGRVEFPEGMTDEQIAAAIKATTMQPHTPGVETAKDVANAVNTGVNWAGTQLTKGVTGLLGIPSVLGGLGAQAAEYAGRKLGVPEGGKVAGQVFRNAITFGGLMQPADVYNQTVFGSLGVPEVNAGDVKALTLHNPLGMGGDVNVGRMLDAGVQAIPGMMALPAGAASATLSPTMRAVTTAAPAFTGGATSELGGQLTAGSPYEPLARVAGGTLGYMLGSRAVTPLPADLTPEQTRLVGVARERGIPMTVGQETGRGRGVESALARFPTSQGRMGAFADTQQRALNRDMLGQVGVQGDRLDPAGMTNVLAEGNRQFNAAKAGGPAVSLDNQFYGDMARAEDRYNSLQPLSERAPAIAEKVADFPGLMQRLQSLLMTGKPPELTSAQYQSYRKGLNDLITPGGDPATNRALQGLRDALDNAMERSGTPAQAEAWHQARQNWANLKILLKAAAGGSADSRSAGNVTPGSLVGALRNRQGADRFATTTGGLNDSARLASYLADTRPNSGTPQTLMMQSMLTGGPIAAGYAAGGLPGAAAAGGAMMLPNLAARFVTGSPGFGWLRDYFANQAMPQSGLPMLQSAGDLPLMLAPGAVVAAPRLENRR